MTDLASEKSSVGEDSGSENKAPKVLNGIKAKVAELRRKINEGKKRKNKPSSEEKKEKLLDIEKTNSEKDEPEEVEKSDSETKPSQEAARKIKEFVHPDKGVTRSFIWAVFASWVVDPQMVIAAFERLINDTDPADWRIAYGPGVWVRDTVKFAWEGGHMPELYVGALIGLVPMVMMSFPGVVLNTRQVMSLVGIGSFVYFVGVAYDWGWEFYTWQLYLATLSALAYYCTFIVYERHKRTQEQIKDALRNGVSEKSAPYINRDGGFIQILLLMPVASVFSALLYAPGAAY